MRRGFLWLLAILALASFAVWAFATQRSTMDPALRFDAAALPEDLDGWLAAREAVFDDLIPGAEKRIVWAGEPGARAPWAVVYLHGFSATSQEIRPLPETVAEGLGANLFFTRLAGHGRTGAAMAAASPEDWMSDTAEALAIGRRLGDRVLVVATSTGATLATIALADHRGARDVAGAVLISPNYRLAPRAGMLLDLPWVEGWGGWVAGAERSFAPVNEGHARWWTTTYPTAALYPLATLMRHARGMDHRLIRTPALFIQARDDRVVDAGATARVADRWGGPVLWHSPALSAEDDPWRHVVAGEVRAPGQTAPLATLILDWARGL